VTKLAIAGARMNGPEGDADFWHSINWSREETSVKRLRQRIFRAAREGDMKPGPRRSPLDVRFVTILC
jgi:RNA-directed DNA polymerase